MAKRSRTKGLGGELEIRRMYEAFGYSVRGLEGLGDQLVLGHGLTIFSEVKRHERCQIWEWLTQTWREAPDNTLPILAFRRNLSPWVAGVPLAQLLDAFQRYTP